MLSGDVQRNLRKLNKNIRIFCGNDDSHPAGIFIVSPSGEYTEICGIDKQYVPEHTTWNDQGFIVKSGYRRVLKILVAKGLVHRKEAEKVFRTHLYGTRAPKAPEIRKDSSLQKLKSMGIDIIERGAF